MGHDAEPSGSRPELVRRSRRGRRAAPRSAQSAWRAARDTTWRMPKVVSRPKVRRPKNVTSCSVITCGVPGARIGATLASLWSRSAPQPPRQDGEQHLLGRLAAHALAVLAGKRPDLRPLLPAVGAQRPGAGTGGGDGDPRSGRPRCQRRRQPAQVGLRPARAAGVEKQRVEQQVRARSTMLRSRAGWATSTGTRSRATGAT